MKNFLIFKMIFAGFLLLYSISLKAGEVVSVSVSENSFCKQSEVTVSFVATGIFNADNFFSAVLFNPSNPNFTPLVIGGLSGSVSGSMPVLVPAYVQSGTYRIRVNASSPYHAGPDNGADLTVRGPNWSLGILGPYEICPNTVGTYKVQGGAANASYDWHFTAPDVTILSGDGTDEITVKWGNTDGSIHFTDITECGVGILHVYHVFLGNVPPARPIINGPASVCPGADVQYSVENHLGNTYTWNVPGDAVITSGQGTSAISVKWGSAAGVVSVVETNNCGSTHGSKYVNINEGPNNTDMAISGPYEVCPNQTVLYTVLRGGANSTYNWQVPPGVTILSGQGTSALTVTWGNETGTLSVTEVTPCGTGYGHYYPVAIGSTLPTPVITGPTIVCNSTNVQYFADNHPGSTYNWNVPADAVITSGQGTSVINVNFGTTGGTVSVIESNSCGSSAAASLSIVVSPLPNNTDLAISGPAQICTNATAVYNVLRGDANSFYYWSVPDGATIVSGQGTSALTVAWGSAGGNLSVDEITGCAYGNRIYYPVAVSNFLPAPVITGTASTCAGPLHFYSVANNPGSTYSWTVPAGGSIVSGQGTNQVQIYFLSASFTANITVVEANAAGCQSLPGTFEVNVTQQFTTPVITGPEKVCVSPTENYTYTTDLIPGISYYWTLPSGATIVSGQGTNEIVVNFYQNTRSDLIMVTIIDYSNECVSLRGELKVTKVSIPRVTEIYGIAKICYITSTYTYSVNSLPNINYNWTVPFGTTIVSGQGTNTINVRYGANASGGNISVQQTASNSTCSSVSTLLVEIFKPLTHPVISGTAKFCANVIVSYSVPAVNGASYSWTVPMGAVIVSGQGTNSITVNFENSNDGFVGITERNACNTVSATYAVDVDPIPPMPVISGPAFVCAGTQAVYSIAPVPGATIRWYTTVPSVQIVAVGDYNVTVRFGSGASSGSVTVVSYYEGSLNSFNCIRRTEPFNITINSAPAMPSVPNRAGCARPGGTSTFTVPPVTGALSYSWSFINASTGGNIPVAILGAANTNTITVRWPSGSRINAGVMVTALNSCGSRTSPPRIVVMTPFACREAASTADENDSWVEESLPAYEVHLYPNPTSSEASLMITGSELWSSITIDISNMQGKVVSTNEVVYTGEPISIGKDLKAGVYLVKIIDNGNVHVIKMIKTE